MSPSDATTPPADRVLAWDGPTRLFKWGLVALVASAWVSDKWGAATPAWHVLNGEAVLVLVVFRCLWGLFGGSTARFAGFLVSPRVAIGYGFDLLRGRERHYLGHNPLGGWMVPVLIGLPAAMGLTGLFNADSDRLVIEGPLSARLSDAAVGLAHRLHHQIFDLLLIAIALHLAAVAFHTLVRRERLVPAMVTGRKPALAYADAAQATPGAIGTALVCLLAAIAIVWGGVAAFS